MLFQHISVHRVVAFFCVSCISLQS